MWTKFENEFTKCTINKAHESFSKMCGIIRYEFTNPREKVAKHSFYQNTINFIADAPCFLHKGRYFDRILDTKEFMNQFRPLKLDKKSKSKPIQKSDSRMWKAGSLYANQRYVELDESVSSIPTRLKDCI
jgi:hypothetical protein